MWWEGMEWMEVEVKKGREGGEEGEEEREKGRERERERDWEVWRWWQ